MAYIGKEPIVGNFQKCDAISVVNGQAAYTLQVSSTNVVPESANHCLVSLNGILQAPVTSFTVSGSTLTFASNLATGDVIDFVILLGNVLDLGTPSDNTVTTAKIADDAVTAAKATGFGKIAQVLQAVKTDTQNTTTDDTWTDVASLSQAITPSATSSKILILFSVNAAADDGDHVGIRLVRDSTNIFIGTDSDAGQNVTTAIRGHSGQVYGVFLMSGQYLDSPSSTSAITYKVQAASNDEFFINRPHDNTGATNVQRPITSSSLTVIEVLA
jgi:hypothetical protein